MTIIAVANQKGGCGKTTTAINLAACLGRKFQRTLLLDMDPQGHASLGLKQHTGNLPGLYEALAGKVLFPDIIISDVLENVDLVPATISLAAADHLLAEQHEREQQLLQLLDEVRDDYDYIVVDCPPSLGLLSVNAMRAADQVLVPVEMGLFALEGVHRLLDTIGLVCGKYNLDIPVRILPTMMDLRTRLARSFMQHLEESFPEQISSVFISYTVKLKESVCEGRPIVEHAPACNAAVDYMRLASEVILGVDGLEIADELMRQELCEKGEQVTEPRYATLRPTRRSVEGSREVVLNYDSMAGKDVKIAGDFNDWIPDKDVETRIVDNNLVKIFQVGPGAYQYRIVVDGNWQHDPNNPEEVENHLGGTNSVLQVQA